MYQTHSPSWHRDYVNGDGSMGFSIDPVPAPIAYTSQMMSDAYLLWRITEDWTSFKTAMGPNNETLAENERCDVIIYF